MVKHEANRVQVDSIEEVFGSHEDNSVDIISILNLSDQAGNNAGGLNRCHMAVDPSLLSSNDELYGSDSEPGPMPTTYKRTKRAPLPARLRQSRYGRIGGKEKDTQEKYMVDLPEEISIAQCTLII